MPKKILLILIVLLIMFLLLGCTSNYSVDEIQSANPEEIKFSTALNMCNDMAKHCSDGDSIIYSKLQQSCLQIADTTTDPYYLLDYAKGMCMDNSNYQESENKYSQKEINTKYSKDKIDAIYAFYNNLINHESNLEEFTGESIIVFCYIKAEECSNNLETLKKFKDECYNNYNTADLNNLVKYMKKMC